MFRKSEKVNEIDHYILLLVNPWITVVTARFSVQFGLSNKMRNLEKHEITLEKPGKVLEFQNGKSAGTLKSVALLVPEISRAKVFWTAGQFAECSQLRWNMTISYTIHILSKYENTAKILT